MLTPEQGTAIVTIARRAISSQFSLLPFRPSQKTKSEYSMPLGCYIFLYVEGRLRGSAGVWETGIPLFQNIVDVARNAAFRNPQFPPLKKQELKQMVIEVNILGRPKRVDVRNPEDYLKKIRPGVDGVMVKGTYTEGAVLPQTGIARKWPSLNYLRHACVQAQLSPDLWQDFDACRVYTFETQIFSESEGTVIQLK